MKPHTPLQLVAFLLLLSAAQAEGVTTVDSFEWIEKPELPHPSEQAETKEVRLERWTVKFPINVWGGWAPIVAANGGFAANPDSIFAKRFGFQVEIEVIEDASEMLTRYIKGETPILWGTVDMMVLFSSQLEGGPLPKIFQQVDWSNGGDGIVVREESVQRANDLRGRKVALAAFSPSHYYLLTVLKAAGIPHDQVDMRFTRTAFGAARAFSEDASLDAMVSFAPDIYAIPEHPEIGKGMRLLTSTADAKRLIADVWAVREDFAAEYPEVVTGLCQGIFEGMEMVNADPGKAAALLFEGFKDFGIPSAEDCEAMMRDAHLTNHAENLAFFTDDRNPTNFRRLWNDAADLYRSAGAITTHLQPERVMDTSVLTTAKMREHWKDSRIEYEETYEVSDATRQRLAERREKDAVVTMIVYFDASSEQFDRETAEVKAALEEVAKLSAKFAGALVLVEGYTDPVTSGLAELEKRKSDNRQVPRIIAARKRRLLAFSATRAQFVREALYENYRLDPEQFHVIPRGGDSPLTGDMEQRWRNRRVEITLMTLESE